jgi:hypothetical protein
MIQLESVKTGTIKLEYHLGELEISTHFVLRRMSFVQSVIAAHPSKIYW